MARAELIYDNKVWLDMIKKLLVKKKRAANTNRRYMYLYFYSNYFQTVEYLMYGDEEKYTMRLYSVLPELI